MFSSLLSLSWGLIYPNKVHCEQPEIHLVIVSQALSPRRQVHVTPIILPLPDDEATAITVTMVVAKQESVVGEADGEDRKC